MTVYIRPLTVAERAIPKRLRLLRTPMFPDRWPPTPEDIELARQLFLELDLKSQIWYSGSDLFRGLL